MSKVLIVEDEPAIMLGLSGQLKREGYELLTAANGDDGYAMALAMKPDLILLDVMLPGMNGYDICRKLRAAGNQTPILMLTARGEETDRVLGLDTGADDYVTKPFSLLELLARVRALLRRAGAAGPETLTVGDIEVDFTAYGAVKSGSALAMTRREIELLRAMAAKPNRVLTRHELLDVLVGEDVHVSNRVIDNLIVSLRAKFGEEHVVTVRGVGYKWKP